MKLIALGAVLGVLVVTPGSAEAQNANPYGGAAGFLYSQGRIAAPGQVGIAGPASAPPVPAAGAADPRASGASQSPGSPSAIAPRRVRDRRLHRHR